MINTRGRRIGEIHILTDLGMGQSQKWEESVTYISPTTSFETFIFKKARSLFSTFSILRQIREFDVVITANIKTSQFFGFFKTFFRIKRPKHIVLELMLDEEKPTFFWSVKVYLQKICFSSVDVIFVSSHKEVEIYSKRLGSKKTKIKYLPFHSNIVCPKIIGSHDDYIFCAGKSGRDYSLLAAAVSGMGKRVVLVSDSESVKKIIFPDNVELFTDILYDKYIDLLKNCTLVVIPLKKLVRSTGQVVMLEAMALGKPVIATATIGTIDYIDDGVNGLLVEPGNAESLRSAIDKLVENKTLRGQLALNAYERVVRYHTFDAYVDEVIRTAYTLKAEWDGQH